MTKEEFWNTCIIIKVISNKYCRGLEEWLLLDNEDKTFRFKIFASCCTKFQIDGYADFDFKKFKPGKKIEVKIGSLYITTLPELVKNLTMADGYLKMKNSVDRKYLVIGEVIKEPVLVEGGRYEGIIKSGNMLFNFTDHDRKSKLMEVVLVLLVGIDNLKTN